MSDQDGGDLTAEEREALARVLWLADGYDLDADPTSRTAREMRPEYLHRADRVAAAGWVPAARVAVAEQERDAARIEAAHRADMVLHQQARAEAAERRAERVTALVDDTDAGGGRYVSLYDLRAALAAPKYARVADTVEQAEHDAEVAAKALQEAADAVAEGRENGIPPGYLSWPVSPHFEKWLRDRAAALAPDAADTTDGGV